MACGQGFEPATWHSELESNSSALAGFFSRAKLVGAQCRVCGFSNTHLFPLKDFSSKSRAASSNKTDHAESGMAALRHRRASWSPRRKKRHLDFRWEAWEELDRPRLLRVEIQRPLLLVSSLFSLAIRSHEPRQPSKSPCLRPLRCPLAAPAASLPSAVSGSVSDRLAGSRP